MLPRSLWWWWILCSYVVNHWVSHDLSPNSPSSRQAFYCDDITVVLASLRGSLPVKTPPAKKPCPGCENPSCFSQWAQLNSARLWKNLPFRSRSAELDGFVWGWWEYWMDRRLSMYYIYIYTYLYSTWITARKEYRNSDHGPMLHEFQANYGYPHGPSQRTSLWDWIPEFDRHGRVISLGHQGCGGCWSLERGVWTRGPSLLLIDGLLTVIEIMIDSGHSRVHSRIG